jgi:hypothetical protein
MIVVFKNAVYVIINALLAQIHPNASPAIVLLEILLIWRHALVSLDIMMMDIAQSALPV